MSYVAYLALFLIVPIVLVTARSPVSRRLIITLAILAVVAVLYTAPWDNQLILHGVWSYGRSHVVGVMVGHIPVEEYAFYVLQVVLTGLITVRLLRGRG